jgi:hypothetical protein
MVQTASAPSHASTNACHRGVRQWHAGADGDVDYRAKREPRPAHPSARHACCSSIAGASETRRSAAAFMRRRERERRRVDAPRTTRASAIGVRLVVVWDLHRLTPSVPRVRSRGRRPALGLPPPSPVPGQRARTRTRPALRKAWRLPWSSVAASLATSVRRPVALGRMSGSVTALPLRHRDASVRTPRARRVVLVRSRRVRSVGRGACSPRRAVVGVCVLVMAGRSACIAACGCWGGRA